MPSIARSRTFAEVAKEPCEKLPCTEVSATPMPVWTEPDPPEIEELIRSAKVALLDLNPTVDIFAILLPITDKAVPLALRPLTPANNEDMIPMTDYLL